MIANVSATTNARRLAANGIMFCSDKCRCCCYDAIASACVGKRFGEKVIMAALASDARNAGMQLTYPPRSAVTAWIFFDWAAQPYFTLITTFVFAPYFATHVATNPASGQALGGFATAAAGLMIALLSPLLGAVADASGRRKPWIAAFGALLVIGSSLVWVGKPGAEGVNPPLLVAYGLSTLGAEFATVFNNAMMPTLVPPEKIGRLSGTGWATGYIGGDLRLLPAPGFLS